MEVQKNMIARQFRRRFASKPRQTVPAVRGFYPGTQGYCPEQQRPATNKRFKHSIIVCLAIFTLAILGAIYTSNAPPCTGTVTGKGCHSKVAGALPGQPGSELVYYISIADDNGYMWWSWYVDKKTYLKYDKGDRLCFFGKISDAQPEQKGGTQ